MSQLSLSSFDSVLMVRSARGRYQPASADQILEAARLVIDQKMPRGESFTSPMAVKEYLGTTSSTVCRPRAVFLWAFSLQINNFPFFIISICTGNSYSSCIGIKVIFC